MNKPRTSNDCVCRKVDAARYDRNSGVTALKGVCLCSYFAERLLEARRQHPRSLEGTTVRLKTMGIEEEADRTLFIRNIDSRVTEELLFELFVQVTLLC